MTSLLTVNGLEVTLGDLPILRGISLTVPRQGIVTVVGANGVGKTTLMRALSGLYPIRQGRIELDGQSIAGLPAHKIVQAGLGQAPEGRQIFAAMSVRENLRLGALGDKQATYMLPQVLALFPLLAERLKQAAGSLSGGEQQQLCIARALMSQPKLLLLDEPSLGLAPKLVSQIFTLLTRIREQGTAILLVEQNARAALNIADHAYVVEGGKITLEGSGQALAQDERVKAAYLGEGATAQPPIHELLITA